MFAAWRERETWAVAIRSPSGRSDLFPSRACSREIALCEFRLDDLPSPHSSLFLDHRVLGRVPFDVQQLGPQLLHFRLRSEFLSWLSLSICGAEVMQRLGIRDRRVRQSVTGQLQDALSNL
nr:hypothetical protein CFP56_21863 [Quercus suber]